MLDRKYFCWLQDQPTQIQVGTKAAYLAQLVRMGLRVPPAICLYAGASTGEGCDTPGFHESLVALEAGLPALLPGESGWAIRSSSMVEDGRESSYAGQFATVIIGEPAELVDAVHVVLASGKEYGKEKMGVIIQEWIEPDLAGVLFTMNPLTGQEELLIECTAGRGEDLVGGKVIPFTFSSGRGWEFGTPAGMTEPICAEMRQTAQSTAKEFGCPVDMEWVLKNGNLYWLQARPVTGIQKEEIFRIPEKERNRLTGKWELMDQCLKPVPPLIQTLDPSGYFIDFPLWDIQFVHHYPYFRFKVDQMPGPGAALQSAPPKSYVTVLHEWHVAERFYHRLFSQALCRDVSDLSNQELWDEMQRRIEHHRQFVQFYLNRYWFAVRRNAATAIRGYVKKVVALPGAVEASFLILVSELATLTMDKQRRLRELRRLAQETVSCKGEAEESAWRKKWDDFLAEYGYESPNPIYFNLPTLAERPERLQSLLLRPNVESAGNPSPSYDHSWREEAVWIGNRLTKKERREFFRQLTLFRKLMVRTENDDYLLQKGATQVRKILLEAGRRLFPDDPAMVFFMVREELRQSLCGITQLVSKPQEQQEPKRDKTWDGPQTIIPSEWMIRKADIARAEKLYPPQTILNGTIAVQGSHFRAGNVLTGRPVSPGVAEGFAYLIHDPLNPDSYTDIPEQAVVVTSMLTPALSGNLINAGALIIEVGSFLSHGAILAREMKIPAVIGIEGVMGKLRNGDYVAVDAYQGEVKVIEGVKRHEGEHPRRLL